MKKIFVPLLAVLPLILLVSGCGNDASNVQNSPMPIKDKTDIARVEKNLKMTIEETKVELSKVTGNIIWITAVDETTVCGEPNDLGVQKILSWKSTTAIPSDKWVQTNDKIKAIGTKAGLTGFYATPDTDTDTKKLTIYYDPPETKKMSEEIVAVSSDENGITLIAKTGCHPKSGTPASVNAEPKPNNV